MANGHGGRREGSGMPSKHGCKTKVMRVPENIHIDQIAAIPELIALLDRWEEKANNNSDNSRYYWLSKAIDEFRALGY